MHLEEADTPVLKTWIIKRLEDISDADSDVLADYVLALVKSDEPDDQVRAVCLENLEDFLHDHAAKFVDDVLNAIRLKSFKPGYVPPKPKISAPNGRPSNSLPQFTPHQASQQSNGSQSRKRTFHERDNSGSGGPHSSPGPERNVKQMRRGGRGGAAFRGGPRAGGGFHGQRGDFQGSPHQMQGLHAPPGLSSLDPNQMMATMQAMGFPTPQQFFGQGSSQTFPNGSQPPRCRDYDTKGFCAAGNKCPYSHGDDHIVMPGVSSNEYDPKDSSITASAQMSPTDSSRPSFSQRPHRGSNRGNRAGRGGHHQNGTNRQNRAAFSSNAPNHDRNITSIVIEQIPEESFSEEAVRSFFSDFGTIEEVTMQAYKHLAIVKYSNWASAKRAYDSPKVVFDNRFVKVYWYKPETVPKPPTNGRSASGNAQHDETQQQQDNDTEMLDPETVAKKTAEAQRLHEEKQKKLEEAATAKADLDRRIREQAEERKKLMEKLAKKAGSSESLANGATASSPTANGSSPSYSSPTTTAKADPSSTASKATDSSQTAALRNKLAELEAEAERLGVPTEDSSSFPSTSYPSRGRGRGRGRPFYRGAPRGRGAWPGFSGGSVARLDNRPKTVELTAASKSDGEGNQERRDDIDFTSDNIGEALRAFLFNIGDYTSLTPSTQTVTIAFRERYIAENFINAINSTSDRAIPGVGTCDIKWVANPPAPAPAPAPPAVDALANAKDDPMGHADSGAASPQVQHQQQQQDHGDDKRDREVDYDVADDDDDRWMR